MRNVLVLLHNGHEVPYIATYRPDEYMPYLVLDDLWRIHDLDRQFLPTQKKRADLRAIGLLIQARLPEPPARVGSTRKRRPVHSTTIEEVRAEKEQTEAEAEAAIALLADAKAKADEAANAAVGGEGEVADLVSKHEATSQALEDAGKEMAALMLDDTAGGGGGSGGFDVSSALAAAMGAAPVVESEEVSGPSGRRSS